MSDDTGGKYICTGGFIISGMIVGSAYGGAAGGAVGGAPAIPGVVIGALGGALWAAAICTRPAVKRFFQMPVDKLRDNFDKAIDASSLDSELRSFVKEATPNMENSEATVAFMLEYLGKNRSEVFTLAGNNEATVLSMHSAEVKQGMEILRTAKPLT